MPRPDSGTWPVGWLAWIGLALRVAAAVVWIVAGSTKIPDLHAFQVLVQRYAILPLVLAGPFAVVLPFLEIGIGLYLLAGLFVRGTSFVGTVLFAVFLTAQVSALARGISIDCGCFGTIAETTVSPLTILRDFCLGIPTFFTLARPARDMSLDKLLFGNGTTRRSS
jgi:uncharacterized membrane protein YphA (DoxX/SURF4 family)